MPSPPRSYGLNPDTELAFVRQMLADPAVLPRLAEHLRPEGFEQEAVRDIVSGALAYFKIAKAIPRSVAVLQEVREGSNEGRYKIARVTAAEDAIGRAMTSVPVASAYLVEKILGEERRRSLWSALEKGLKLYQGGRHDDIAAEVARAALVGKGDSVPGVDYGGTLEQRTERRMNRKTPPRWGTGIADLDDLIDGGLTTDNPLGIVLGGPKFGKSLFLDHVAMHHMALGGMAVFFTMEMGVDEVFTRHDAAVSGIPIKYVNERAREVGDYVSSWLARVKGGLHVKKFPGGGVTAPRHLDAYLEQIRIEEGIVPTVIVADYIAEMAADDPNQYERRHEAIAAIASQLRGLGEKHKSIVWSASQIKADALEKETPSISDIAGAFAQAAIADLVVAICRTPIERRDGRIRFFVAASRISADGVATGSLPSAYEMGRIVVEKV